MKRLRYTKSQVMDALKRVEVGLAIPFLWQDGVSVATIYKWHPNPLGSTPSMMAHMKELEE